MKAFFFTKRAFRKKLVKISNDVCGVRIRAEREYCVVRSAELIIDKKRNVICKAFPAQQILPLRRPAIKQVSRTMFALAGE